MRDVKVVAGPHVRRTTLINAAWIRPEQVSLKQNRF
jgi:hypothetical protein